MLLKALAELHEIKKFLFNTPKAQFRCKECSIVPYENSKLYKVQLCRKCEHIYPQQHFHNKKGVWTGQHTDTQHTDTN